jgi:hypothetical protein
MTDIEFEELGYAETQLRFERGDYCDPAELNSVKQWLQAKDKEQEFIAACQRASMSSALDANRTARLASLIAFFAFVVSVISAREQLGSFVGVILSLFGLR